MDIRDQLKRNFGYVTDKMIDPFIQEFGADFQLVAKDTWGNRRLVEAGNIKDYAILKEREEGVPVKEVFMCSSDFRKYVSGEPYE
jgi:hypothetical protein